LRIEPNGLNEQINPILRGEKAAFFEVVFKRKARDLKRRRYDELVKRR
jgi:hypothetical protein